MSLHVASQVLLHDNKPGYYDCVLVQQKVRDFRSLQSPAASRMTYFRPAVW